MSMKRILSLLLVVTASLTLMLPASAQNNADETVEIIWLPSGIEIAKKLLGSDKTLQKQDLIPVQNESGKYGYVNVSGTIIIPCEFDRVEVFSEGLAWVMKRDEEGNQKYGCINAEGEIVIPLSEYDGVESFSEGVARVMKNDEKGRGKYGYINTKGEVVVPLDYDDAGSHFSEGLTWIGKRVSNYEWQCCYINTKGAVVLALEYDHVSSFSDGLAWVEISDEDYRKYGYINTEGELVVPLEYDDAFFHEGLAWVKKDDEEGYSYFDAKRGEVVPWEGIVGGYPKYFFDGLCMASNGQDTWGGINTKGELIIPFEYDLASRFFNGLAVVAKRDADGNLKYGCINTKGEAVLPLEYDRAAGGGYIFEVTNGANSGFFINPYYEDESEDENLPSITGGGETEKNETPSSTEPEEGVKPGESKDNTPVILCVGASVVLAAVVFAVMAMRKRKAADIQVSKQSSVCSCGAKNPPAAKFCIDCGKPVEQPTQKYCANCGTVVADGAKFCANCGAVQNNA